MKKKELVIVNVLMASIVFFFAVMTANLSANQDIASFVKDSLMSRRDKKDDVLSASVSAQRCSKKSELAIGATEDRQLRKLDSYQKFCGSLATDTIMIFTSFPGTVSDAQTAADTMTQKLKRYQQAGVKPLLIVEPYAGDKLMSYKHYLSGAYDAAVDRYFARLKEVGLTDQTMGTWVPFPESNTPNWDNKDTEPRDFALCVNKYLTSFKKYFPTAKGSILLNSTTYDPNDLEWENGDYFNLTPYIQEIDRKLVDSVGIQGFPWVSNATTRRREIFRASEFLQPELAISAAQELRTRDIWFNTGTFASKYTNDPKRTVHVSLNERKAILSGILDEVKKVQTYQQNEYRVSINLFSEDKSSAKEATDWSYNQNSDSQTLFIDFLRKAEELTIPVSLFDR